MMRCDRIDNNLGFLILLTEIHTNLNMRSFYFMVN